MKKILEIIYYDKARDFLFAQLEDNYFFFFLRGGSIILDRKECGILKSFSILLGGMFEKDDSHRRSEFTL